ncbi:prolyl-tRNA synthetase associated domain-containing protein [Ruminiclostridium hungatei]|nr:prolyl-tRNA synthetase associated domain-containing protein [Ruminiclostridium hungatei]
MGNFVTDTTIYRGKPESGLSERQQRELAAYELLEELDIGYLRLDHGETATIEDCHEVEKLLKIEICKNLFLCNSAKTSFYLLVMPGSKKFDTKTVARQINSSRLSFAPAEFIEEYLNIKPGSVSILGLMNDREKKVKLLIDRDILKSEYFGCHPCVNTSSLKIKTGDLLSRFLPYTGHTPVYVDL